MSRSPIPFPFGAIVFLASAPPRPPLDRAAVGHRDCDPSESPPHADAVASIVALKPVLVLTSDLRQDTFAALRVADAGGIPLAFDPRLRDRAFGAWEGRTWTDLVATVPEVPEFLANFDSATPPGGESLAQVASRAEALLSDTLLKRHRQTIAVVASPTVIRAVTASALRIPQQVTCRWRIDPHSTTGLRSEGTFSTLVWVNRFGASLF